MNVTIRDIEFTDADWLARSEIKAFGKKIAWKLSDYCQIMREGCYCMVAGAREPKAVIFIDPTDRKGFRIISLFTDPGHKRRGYAKKLLRYTIECAFTEHRTGKVNLLVSATNEAAINLYKGVGFAIKKTLKNFYGPGKNAYYMETEPKFPAVYERVQS